MRTPVAFALLLLLAAGHPIRANDAEATAVKALEKAGGKITRDLTVPAKPIVEARLPAKATDEHMKLLKAIPGLRRVEIPGGEVSDIGLEELLALKKLKELEMSFLRGVTDVGMATVAKLDGLESLTVRHNLVGDHGMRALKKLKSLRSLSLNWTRVKDAGVAHIGEMTELRSLDLSGTHVTDVGLTALKKLKRLEELHLSNTDVSDAGVKHLKELPSLVSLGLIVHTGPTPLTDDCLADLAELKKLKYLRLGTSAMTADGLAKLAKMPALEELDLVVSALLPTGYRFGQTRKEIDALRKLFPKKCRITADGFSD